MEHIAHNAGPRSAHFVVTQFGDLIGAADAVRAGAVVIVEFEYDRDLQRRGVDFLSGIAFGTQSELEKLDDQMYRVTPPI